MESTNNLIFGVNPIVEALQEGKTVDKIFINKNSRPERFNEINQLCKASGTPIQMVPEEKLNRLTRKVHQGIVAFLSPVDYHNLEDTIQEIFESGEDPFIILLDQITDVRNMGAICRSAECAGAHAVVIPKKGSAGITPDSIKTSAGAIFKLKIIREDNLKLSVAYLKAAGIKVVSCTEKAEESYYDHNLAVPIAFILGSEEFGIAPAVRKLADADVKIPMLGTTDSLNVSVAAGIVFFERARQISLKA